jgi:hypothetical protein
VLFELLLFLKNKKTYSYNPDQLNLIFMKTLILTITLVLTFAVSFAQSGTGKNLKDQSILQFVTEQGVLLNDSVLKFERNDPFADIVETYKIKSTYADTMHIRVRKITHQLVNGAMNTFCLDYCFPPSVDTSEILQLPPYGEQFFELYYNSNGNSGLTDVTFEVYDLETLGEKVSAQIHVKYHVSPNSLFDEPKLIVSNPFPNPASTRTTFTYTLPDHSANAIVVFRNMLGQQVLTSKLNASSDRTTVELSSLKSGMYTYSVIIDGKTNSAGKLIVK